MGDKRPNPRERVELIIRALSEEPQTVTELAAKSGMKWGTAWDYLRLIRSCQGFPKIGVMREGKRGEMWRREWGKMPT